jgi:hypothetical protein
MEKIVVVDCRETGGSRSESSRVRTSEDLGGSRIES